MNLFYISCVLQLNVSVFFLFFNLGIINLCKAGNSGIQSLIGLLCIPNMEVRVSIETTAYQICKHVQEDEDICELVLIHHTFHLFLGKTVVILSVVFVYLEAVTAETDQIITTDQVFIDVITVTFWCIMLQSSMIKVLGMFF